MIILGYCLIVLIFVLVLYMIYLSFKIHKGVKKAKELADIIEQNMEA